MPAQKLSGVRLKLFRAYREYRAVLVLTNALSPDERLRIDRSLVAARSISSGTAKRRLDEVLDLLERARNRVGVRAELRELAPYAQAESFVGVPSLDNKLPGNSPWLMYFPKYVLAQMFSRYERVFPAFVQLPPHTLVGIDLFGNQPKRAFETYLLDASLFEDMAVLVNAATDKWNQLEAAASPSKPELKLLESLIRSAAKAAFSLVEGYINGVGQDILLTRTVSAKERQLISEWDESRNRPRFLSLRDKVLQYPKMALSLAAPPLDEGKSEALKRVLELEKRVRHSLIHPSPQAESSTPELDREFEFRSFRLDQLGQLCDAAVDLIFDIDSVLGGLFGRASYWLFRRQANGKFSDSVFF